MGDDAGPRRAQAGPVRAVGRLRRDRHRGARRRRQSRARATSSGSFGRKLPAGSRDAFTRRRARALQPPAQVAGDVRAVRARSALHATHGAMAFDGPLLGGRYRLGPRLGHGSQGEIFLARDEQGEGRRRQGSHRQAADAARHVEVVRAVRARGEGPLAAAPRRRAAPPRDHRGAARHVQPRHAARARREPARPREAPPAVARPSCATS